MSTAISQSTQTRSVCLLFEHVARLYNRIPCWHASNASVKSGLVGILQRRLLSEVDQCCFKVVKKFDDMFSRFDKVHESNGNRPTDRRNSHYITFAYAVSCEKKIVSVSLFLFIIV